jgi:hypothetical protein
VKVFDMGLVHVKSSNKVSINVCYVDGYVK